LVAAAASLGAGAGGAQPVAVAAGLQDVGVEGETVDDGGGQARIREGMAPFKWDWHTFPPLIRAC
jgi:hypothetical protein